MAEKIILGKVLVTLEGEHDSTRSYDKYCEVTSGGSSYVSKKDVPIGTPITDTTYWQKRASKGADGTNGMDGNDGVDAYQPFKGWYSDTTELNTSFGSPVVGDYAYVKGASASDPVTIYECNTAGTWVSSGRTFNPSNNQEFASGEALNVTHIVDNLNSSSATDVLSAKQGKMLGAKISEIIPATLTVTSDTMTIDTTNGVITTTSSSIKAYYAPVMEGQEVHITASNSSAKAFRYGFTQNKPAYNVAVSGATQISVTSVDVTPVAPFDGYIVLCHSTSYFTDHQVDVSSSRINDIGSVIYKVKDKASISWQKNYRVSTLGKASTANGYALSGFMFARKGSTIGVSSSAYTFDYAIWKTNSTATNSDLIRSERDLSGTITTNVDGWLRVALHEVNHDTALTDEEVATLVANALVLNVKYPITEDIDKKVDYSTEQDLSEGEKSIARNNIGAAGEDDLDALDTKLSNMESEIFEYNSPQGVTWEKGYLNRNTGGLINYKNALRSSKFKVNAGSFVTLDTSVVANLIYDIFFFDADTGSLISHSDFTNAQVNIENDCAIRILVTDETHKTDYEYVLPDLSYAEYVSIKVKENKLVDGNTKSLFDGRTELVLAQRYVAEDWHLPFIDVTGLGQGANHIIPGTAKTWSESGTRDLVQKNVWMYDGIHPYGNGTEGIMKMYARTIANQLARISPSYKVDDESDGVPSYWEGKVFCWLGTSIPAGNDPTLDIQGATDYPRLVALQLGAGTRVNLARGSSMMRINSADGKFSGIPKSHFLRAATRSIAEADYLATPEVWAEIYASASSYGSAASESDVNVMKAASWETFLKPYLDGTNTMPDIFVIDHGHNDYAVKNGIYDWSVLPTQDNINKGLLVEDTYMTDNDYANLKLALNNDLSGISDLASFAVSLNRNCFIGAMNFLITVILRYNPYARIAIVSDYN